MYEKIKSLPTAYESYAKRMVEKNIMTEAEIKEKRDKFFKEYEVEYQKVMNDKFDTYEAAKDVIYHIKPVDASKGTGVNKATL